MKLTPKQKNNFNIAQIAFHIQMANEYCELAKQFHEVQKHEKSMINSYQNKLNFIVNDMKFRLRNSDPDIVKDLFNSETAAFMNSIQNIACQVAVESREPFEYLFENLTTGNLEMFEDGETIIIKPKNKTI